MEMETNKSLGDYFIAIISLTLKDILCDINPLKIYTIKKHLLNYQNNTNSITNVNVKQN